MKQSDLFLFPLKVGLSSLLWKRLLQLLPWQSPIYTLHSARQSGRSVAIRHIDGGSSNAAEQEVTALFNPIYDLERFGFELVTSPRAADLLLITGPLVRNMEAAVLAAFHAMPEPRRVVTMGDSFQDGDIFSGCYAVIPLPDEIAAARVAHIPGDPPTPKQIMAVLHELSLLAK